MTQEKFKKIQILKTLGVPVLGDWEDYLQYGFDANDIDWLLAIIKQDVDINFEEDKDAIYVPIYAWRVLGQLGDESIINPLISTLNGYAVSDDDWALCELPKVFALLGEKAIQSLQQFMCVKTNEEYARANASDGLFEIYSKDNSLRDKIIKSYKSYLENPDVFAYALNGLIIGCLMRLKGHELLDEVESLYAKDCVDLTICGNFDDYEMALGLRIKNSMSEVDHRKLMFEQHTSKIQTDLIGEIKKAQPEKYIAKILTKYSHDHSIKNISQLNGYLASVVCSDQKVYPSQWSLDIWDGKKQEPQWQDHQEYKTFNNCLYDYFKSIEYHIEDFDLESIISKISDLNKKNDWCVGFMKGIHYWNKSPEDFEIHANIQYSIIAILASDKAKETIEMMSLGINDDNIIDAITHAFIAVYEELQLTQEDIETYHQPDSAFLTDTATEDFDFQSINTTPYIREGKKVGRNEPCPCGSGKKYKKCCINK